MSDPKFNTPAIIDPFGLVSINIFYRANGSSYTYRNYGADVSFVDIDGDGDLDAFIGGEADTRFFRNTGNANTPVFTVSGQQVIYPFGISDIYQSKATFADIDGDGDMDAFMGDIYGDVLIYRNTGTATNPVFTTAGNVLPNAGSDTGAAPYLADIDGDGDLDAFIGNNSGKTLFYRNTGDSRFAIFEAETGGSVNGNPFGLTDVGSLSQPTLVDIDGDGDLDAFIGNGLGDVSFFRNIGTANNPVFAASTSNPFGLYNISTSSNPPFSDKSIGWWAAISFADIDGDGDLDAFIGERQSQTFFFRNDQAGVHISKTGDSTAVTEGGVTDTYTVVLNSLPTADVTINLTNDNQVVSNFASLTFTTANWNVPQTVIVTAVNDTIIEGTHNSFTQYTATSADADYNNIAIADVNVTITDNDFHDPTFNYPLRNPFGLSRVSVNAAPALVDIEGDGDLDLFVGSRSGFTDFYRNTGTAHNPTFVKEIPSGASYGTPFGLNLSVSDVVDVDTNTIVNNPTTPPTHAITLSNDKHPAFVDIDGDGDQDAFIGDENGNTLFFRNTGSASNAAFFVETDGSLNGNPFGFSHAGGTWGEASPTFADIDNDKDFDAFIGGYDGKIVFYRNTGTKSSPIFVAQTGGSVDGNPFGLTHVDFVRAAPTFIDIERDGDLDALIGDAFGNTYFFRNIGTADSPAFAADPIIKNRFGLTNLQSSSSPAVGDINGDGEMDIIAGNNKGNLKVYIHNNEHTGHVMISGISQQAEVLTAYNTLADVNGLGIIRYQWQANGVNIAKANSNTYKLTGAELGKVITVTARYIDGSGVLEKETSAATAPVAENFTNFGLYGDKGGTRPDTLEGASGNDGLYGLTDNDVLLGGRGNDVLYGFYGADSLYGGDGNDRLYGEQDNDSLEGGTGNDTLDGGFGVDTMSGGEGNDTYYLSYDAVDVIIDNGLSTDIDTVIMPYQLNVYTLPADIENGTMAAGVLSGSLEGNNGNNMLTGNSGENTLTGGDGDDTVNAGDGNDEIVGGRGAGNDTYNGGSSTDSVRYSSAITGITVNLTAGIASGNEIGNDALINIENIIGGQGNDTLLGNSSGNVISGHTGNDTLTGGGGMDIFNVDSGTDTITDLGYGGADVLVVSSGTTANATTLGVWIASSSSQNSGTANLTANGLTVNLSAINTGNGWNVTNTGNGTTLIGSALSDSITGGLGNDLLNGSLGNNTLTGGVGRDTFLFNTAPTTNVDKITDFVVIDDTIQLENAIFTSLINNVFSTVLPVTSLRSGVGVTSAADTDDFVIYNTSTGALYYDAGGNTAGSAAAVQIALLGANLALTSADFVVI